MELRTRALQTLCLTEPAQKVASAQLLHAQAAPLSIAKSHFEPFGDPPGRPARPVLVERVVKPQRSPFTPDGLATLLHTVAHIEFNAINLALDAAWRFDDMPDAFYLDWVRVASEEAYHFSLLRTHLQSLVGEKDQRWDYGDFPAHDGLWTVCAATSGDVVARMALVPRTLEARGLDATPLIQAKLRRVATPQALRAVEILEIILTDEVGHVAIGNHWYRWLCQRDGLDPVAHYRVLADRYDAPTPKPPFNTRARLQAGFTDEELAILLA
ncbi:ferritin-like domain-containing protein [Rhodoferax sp.]|uniref:ferritin-like domain-containing protein n=1 Tax=Rhodoferax sp. TaxID=50421 RepID=UPI0025E931A5|nr:ferritin-like domain-containing protein [Rhodoferax sp.]